MARGCQGRPLCAARGEEEAEDSSETEEATDKDDARGVVGLLGDVLSCTLTVFAVQSALFWRLWPYTMYGVTGGYVPGQWKPHAVTENKLQGHTHDIQGLPCLLFEDTDRACSTSAMIGTHPCQNERSTGKACERNQLYGVHTCTYLLPSTSQSTPRYACVRKHRNRTGEQAASDFANVNQTTLRNLLQKGEV